MKKKSLAYRLMTGLALLGVAIVSVGSWSYWHQEETPAELLK
jgi:cyclic lactone autoinducer peptide